MAYSRQTENYGLPLPLGTDKSTWLDTNDGFEAVDLALAGAVAKGATHDAAIEDLSTGLTSLGTTVAGHTTDIAALDSRMTAEETIGANATRAIAQLSEKVYDFEERTFTTAAECFAFLASLSVSELNDVVVIATTRSAGTKRQLLRDATGAATVNTTTASSSIESGICYKLAYASTIVYQFSENNLSTNADSMINAMRTVYVEEAVLKQKDVAYYTYFTNVSELAEEIVTDLTSITLLVPVAVADD